MSEWRRPASRVSTWVLAVVFLILFDVVFTRSSILWGKTSFEDTRTLGGVVFGQTYQAARKIYARPHSATATRIVLLGDSRVRLPVRETSLSAALRRARPESDFDVYNLGIFGAAIGDMEVVSRHLGKIDPTLVVLAVDELSLIGSASSNLHNLPTELLDIGWADGPVASSWLDRSERWASTIWPLFRFREFARRVLIDRIWPDPTANPWPEVFADSRALFAYAHGEERADAIEAAYRRWRADPDLRLFLEYLQVERAMYIEDVRRRTRVAKVPAADARSVQLLEFAVGNLAETFPGRVALLLLPRNPLLEEDAESEFERQDVTAGAIAAIEGVARRTGVGVMDTRSSMPVEAFFDFDHMMPDQAGFEPVLAKEIVGVLAR